MVNESDNTLLRRFLMRDTAALERVERIVRQVISYRGYYVPDSEHSDLVQDSMLDIWKAVADDSRRPPDKFKALVGTIAHCRCVDWMRRLRRVEPLDEAIPVSGKETSNGSVLQAERVRLGNLVILQLRPACRQLIRLHVKEELTYREIARLVGRSVTALTTQMSKCLKEARDLLTRHRPARREAR